jgi:hypothetical protein
MMIFDNFTLHLLCIELVLIYLSMTILYGICVPGVCQVEAT